MNLNDLISGKTPLDRGAMVAHVGEMWDHEGELALLKYFFDADKGIVAAAAVAAEMSESRVRAWLKRFLKAETILSVPSGLRAPGAPKKAYKATDLFKSIVYSAIETAPKNRQSELQILFGLKPAVELDSQPSQAETHYFCSRYMNMVAPFIAFVEKTPKFKSMRLAMLVIDHILKAPKSKRELISELGLPRHIAKDLLRMLKAIQARFGLIERHGGRFRIVPEKRLLISYAKKL